MHPFIILKGYILEWSKLCRYSIVVLRTINTMCICTSPLEKGVERERGATYPNKIRSLIMSDQYVYQRGLFSHSVSDIYLSID